MSFSSEAYVLLSGKIKKVATGVKNVAVDSTDPSKLNFTLNDAASTVISVNLPNPLTTTEIAMINRMTIDTDGYLCVDGARVSDLTPQQIALLKRFDVNADGDPTFDGESIKPLTDDEREQIDNLTENVIVNKTGDDVSSIEIGGIEFEPIYDLTDPTLMVGVKINGQEVVTSNDETADTDITYPSTWV